MRFENFEVVQKYSGFPVNAINDFQDQAHFGVVPGRNRKRPETDLLPAVFLLDDFVIPSFRIQSTDRRTVVPFDQCLNSRRARANGPPERSGKSLTVHTMPIYLSRSLPKR